MNVRHKAMIVGGLLLVAGLFVGVKASASAVYIANEEGSSTIPKGKVVDGSAYLAGNTVVVEGTVKGDIFCAGNSVRIEGVVEGDVLCAGNSVTVGGTVNGDVRLAGATIHLTSGKISGNATVAGAEVHTAETFTLGGDLTGGADMLSVSGTIGRDITAGSTNFTLNGNVGRDVMTSFETVMFESAAKVGGNFVYSSPEKATIANGIVGGKTEFHVREASSQADGQAAAAAVSVIMSIAVALLALLGAVVLPRQVHNVGNVKWGTFGIAVALGLSFVVTVPLLVVLLLATGIGFVAAYVVLLVWLLAMAVAPVGFAHFIGTKVYGKNTQNVVLRSLVGAILLLIALLIPVLQFFAFMAMLFGGVGLILARLPKLYEGKPYQVPQAEPVKKNKAGA
jgi:hypothetical protein